MISCHSIWGTDALSHSLSLHCISSSLRCTCVVHRRLIARLCHVVAPHRPHCASCVASSNLKHCVVVPQSSLHCTSLSLHCRRIIAHEGISCRGIWRTTSATSPASATRCRLSLSMTRGHPRSPLSSHRSSSPQARRGCACDTSLLLGQDP